MNNYIRYPSKIKKSRNECGFMQRIAIIDVGSNSARLVITQIYKNGAYNMVYNQKEALRLSQKVDKNGILTQEAFADTLECMRSFATMCKLFTVDKIVAVATAAMRNAKNGKELTSLVEKGNRNPFAHTRRQDRSLRQLLGRNQHDQRQRRHHL